MSPREPITVIGVRTMGVGIAQTAAVAGHPVARGSWRALELTKLALQSNRAPTTTFDIAAQALLFESTDKTSG